MNHIVVASDSTYLRHTAVMLVSLFENNKGTDITVHLITIEPDKTELERFINTIKNFGQKLCVYNFDKNLLDTLPKGTHKYITSATYCRLFLQDILPTDIEKVLYLDGDIIVTGNINDLWETNIEGKLVAATSDEVNGYADYYARFGFPSDHVYFNAGVLLINMKEWRNADIKKQAFDFLANPNRPQLDNADQDILNVLCVGRIKEIPLRYNLQDAILRRSVPNIRRDVEATIEDEIKEGKIFHFSCKKKPWSFRCIHPMKKEYYRYLESTEWKGIIEGVNDKDVIYMVAYWCAYILRLTNRYRKIVSDFAEKIEID